MWNLFKKQEKEPWQIAAARFCVNNSEQGFKREDLNNYIKSIYKVSERHLSQFFEEEIQRPTGREYNRSDFQNYWTPPLDLVSKITDYDELKEARKNSRQAFWFSLIAIIISLITLLIAIF